MTAPFMTERDYAKHRGVDARTVKSAVANGLIPLNADGAIIVGDADASWSPTPGGRPAKDPSPEARAKAAVTLQLSELDLEAKRMAIAAARGEMLDRSAAVAALERFAEAIGKSVDAWPDRAAEKIAHLLTCPECKRRVPKNTIATALAPVADDTRKLIANDVLGEIPKAKPPKTKRR